MDRTGPMDNYGERMCDGIIADENGKMSGVGRVMLEVMIENEVWLLASPLRAAIEFRDFLVPRVEQ
jgi:hypothetical protein